MPQKGSPKRLTTSPEADEEEEQRGAVMEEEEDCVMPCLEPGKPLVDAVQSLGHRLQRGHDARHLVHLLWAHLQRQQGEERGAGAHDEVNSKT